MMVQHCQQPMTPPSPSSIYSASSHPEGLEQGLHALPPVVPSTQLPTLDPKPRLILSSIKVARLLERRPGNESLAGSIKVYKKA